jgi:acetylornithine aminotransferase
MILNGSEEESMSHLIWYPGHELLLLDIVRAENCRLWDSKGKEYIDLESGVWCTSVGHGNPRVLRAIEKQYTEIAHTGFNYTSGIVEECARIVLSLLGMDGGRCVFLCSGSEAVEYGVRVAQMIMNRPLLMTMADSYFGAYGSARRRGEDEWYSFDWMECTECPDADECGDGCEHWAAIPFDKIGGFLFEPGSSSGLVRFPPDKVIRNIVKTIEQNDGLVLVNEVTTGVGRTGKWFGYQHYGISPDIVGIGKGIGNGYPVSITGFSPRVMERLGDEPVNYAQSHQNDPLGAVVVREVIGIIREENLIERSREIAGILTSGLERIRERSGRIKEIRARGLMVGIELEDDEENSCTIRIHRELTRQGFVLGRRPGVRVLRLDPGLTIESGGIESFLDAFEDVLNEEFQGI